MSAHGAAMLVRRELLLELGGFDETFFMEWEDLDLCWRAWLRGQAASTSRTPGCATASAARRAHAMVGLSLLAVFLLIVFLDARRLGHLDTGDSNNLVHGTRSALDCLADGDLVGCGHPTGSIQTEVFPYPFLQYMPSALFVALGMSDSHVLVALGIVSFIAFAAALLVVVAAFRDRARHGALIVLAVVGSSAVYHSHRRSAKVSPPHWS